MESNSTGLEIVCISEFCHKYKVSNLKRERLGILNSDVTAIKEKEYMELLDLINRSREMQTNLLLKRKLKDTNYTTLRNVKSKWRETPENFNFSDEATFQYIEETEYVNELPESIFASHLNEHTQLNDNQVIKYPDIIESDGNDQITQVQQETSPVPNFIILTSEDNQWQSSPINFF